MTLVSTNITELIKLFKAICHEPTTLAQLLKSYPDAEIGAGITNERMDWNTRMVFWKIPRNQSLARAKLNAMSERICRKCLRIS
jgi:hypothetical protein